MFAQTPLTAVMEVMASVLSHQSFTVSLPMLLLSQALFR